MKGKDDLMPPVTVVVTHHERATLEACLRLLRPEKGVRVVGAAGSGLETIAAARLKPRVLLLDVHLSPGNGVALLPVLRRHSPQTRVILLTRRTSEARILEALSHGALGYIDKKDLQTFLLKAVRVVAAGEAWMRRKMVAKVLDRLGRLTARAGRKDVDQSPIDNGSWDSYDSTR